MQSYVLFYFIFFRKSLPLMFYPSYQNGGKILGTEKLPQGEVDTGIDSAFFKTNY